MAFTDVKVRSAKPTDKALQADRWRRNAFNGSPQWI